MATKITKNTNPTEKKSEEAPEETKSVSKK